MDRRGDVGVQAQRLGPGIVRHQVVLGAAGEDFGDDPRQPGEHLVAGEEEDAPVELDVQPQELRQVPLLADGDHTGAEVGQFGAFLRGSAPGRRGGGQWFDRRAQLGQGAQLCDAAGAFQPPADELRVVDAPLLRGAYADAGTGPAHDEPHRLQHPYGFARHSAGDPVVLHQAIEGEDVPGTVFTGRDRRA